MAEKQDIIQMDAKKLNSVTTGVKKQ